MKAIFAAGCFWGVEEAFRKLEGVKNTRVGYVGGKIKNPSYTLVCTGLTGHAEAVEVEYDPKTIDYNMLLETFWSIHNPTQGNRQGWDIGSQYRSAIFYTTEMQKNLAKKSLEEKQKKHMKDITTKIEKATKFYPAEEYHQKYLMKKGLKVCH